MILWAGAMLSLLALGFVLFASVVTRLPAENNPHADGIVVLTGEGTPHRRGRAACWTRAAPSAC